jgi:hypothetical protein
MFEQSHDINNSSDENISKKSFVDSIGSQLLDSLKQFQNDKPLSFTESIVNGILNVPPLENYKKHVPGNLDPRPGEVQDIPRDRHKEFAEALKDALASDRFKKTVAESADSLGLSKGPLGPVIKELGEQLASGKIDSEKIQKLMKDAKFPAEDYRAMRTLLQRFSDDLADEYGIDVQFKFEGKGDKMQVSGISVQDNKGAHQFNMSLNFYKEGPADAQEVFTEGHTGPIVKELTTEKALQRFKEKMIHPKVRLP